MVIWRLVVIHEGLVRRHELDICFLHLQAIWICPESALGVEATEHFEIHGDIFALVVVDGDWVEFHVKLNKVIK